MQNLGDLLFWLLVAMGTALALAAVGLALMWRSIRRLDVPPTAGFFATMRYIPLPLVVVLDLLDFGLDIFAAPVSWVLLDRLGLRGLRNKAAIEALIPFTQPIPTFTIAWVAARTLGLGDDDLARVIEGEALAARRQLPR
ncbi:MAG TPA: hypothetical protein PKD53_22030 [Chloroflexaceae bacterium]|nr:hypothetical protein [Chloroflexaceae bacterium]